MGILFTPAPALAIASRLGEKSIDFISWLLTIIAWASLISSTISYSSVKASQSFR